MTRPNLLLLHGALGAQDQFDALVPMLNGDFTVYRLNFEGHGDTPDQGRSFRTSHFVENVLGYLNEYQVDSTHILGYSLGGYVACTLAEGHPDRVRHIVTLGTRYPWDAATAKREVTYLNPEQIEAKVPQFARLLAERHIALGWKTVVAWTAELLWNNAAEGGLSAERLSRLDQPIRIMVGDRDTTAGVAESIDVYRTLQHGQLEVLPNTPHPLERVDLARIAQSVRDFCLQSTGN